MPASLDSLPVELIAEVLSALDLQTLVTMAYLSRRLHSICADQHFNPWRWPISHSLHAGAYEPCLRTLSVRAIVPRANFVAILSAAKPAFLLFEATLPNLRDDEWKECFNRRFLPSWRKWKRSGGWRAAFLQILYRMWHRGRTHCTSEEGWTEYLVLHKKGHLQLQHSSSRNFSPLALFDEMKFQSNLMHLETCIRVVVEFADVRILALGIITKPRGPFYVNQNARFFMHPPGADPLARPSAAGLDSRPLRRLTHPAPSHTFANYPFYTPGGGDVRWTSVEEPEENGVHWVGGLMLVAQVLGPSTKAVFPDAPESADIRLVVGPGRNQYASLSWADLDAVAPWMEQYVRKDGDGPGY